MAAHKHEYKYQRKIWDNGRWKNHYVCACGAEMRS